MRTTNREKDNILKHPVLTPLIYLKCLGKSFNHQSDISSVHSTSSDITIQTTIGWTLKPPNPRGTSNHRLQCNTKLLSSITITYVFRKSPQWVFYLCFVSGSDQEIRERLRTKFKPNQFIKMYLFGKFGYSDHDWPGQFAFSSGLKPGTCPSSLSPLLDLI